MNEEYIEVLKSIKGVGTTLAYRIPKELELHA